MNWNLIYSLWNSATVYDEKHCMVKHKARYPDIKKMRVHEIDTDFMLTYMRGDTLVINGRGTDGTNLKKWVKAWRANFKINPDINGYAEGFNIFGDFVMKQIAKYYDVKSVEKVEMHGHSRAGSGIQNAGLKIADKYRVPVHITGWAPPPVGNYKIADDYAKLHGEGLIYIKLIGNPGDPVATLFRHISNKEKNGIDLVPITWLPPDTKAQKLFKWLPFLVNEHSPKEYLDGLVKWFQPNDVSLNAIKEIKKDFVN